MKTTIRALVLLVAITLAIGFGTMGAWAAITTTSVPTVSRLGEGFLHHEDTSAANTAITLTVPAQTYARTLRSISAVCSASATVTVTSKIVRTITSGTADILLADISISAGTSGAQYVEIPLLPADTVEVTIPAAGAAITCSPMVVEARQ